MSIFIILGQQKNLKCIFKYQTTIKNENPIQKSIQDYFFLNNNLIHLKNNNLKVNWNFIILENCWWTKGYTWDKEIILKMRVIYWKFVYKIKIIKNYFNSFYDTYIQDYLPYATNRPEMFGRTPSVCLKNYCIECFHNNILENAIFPLKGWEKSNRFPPRKKLCKEHAEKVGTCIEIDRNKWLFCKIKKNSAIPKKLVSESEKKKIKLQKNDKEITITNNKKIRLQKNDKEITITKNKNIRLQKNDKEITITKNKNIRLQKNKKHTILDSNFFPPRKVHENFHLQDNKRNCKFYSKNIMEKRNPTFQNNNSNSNKKSVPLGRWR